MRKGSAAMLLVTILLAGCAVGGGTGAGGKRAKAPRASLAATPVDSATVLLWHLDESTGTLIEDASPNDIGGRAGVDTRIDLGRIHGARTFSRSVDSFLYAEYRPEMEARQAMTVEAWIRLDAIGSYEDTPIAMRWNPRGAAESWIFTVGGQNVLAPFASLPGPGDHNDLLLPGFQNRATDRLLFAFLPSSAGQPRAIVSNQALDLHRWIHVAATFDSRLMCLYIDGRLDSQIAVSDEIRESEAPLLVGNSFDPRELTTQSGELQVGQQYDHNPYYAFQGTIDELRISNVARTSFPYVR
jgi:hypothetical protein